MDADEFRDRIALKAIRLGKAPSAETDPGTVPPAEGAALMTVPRAGRRHGCPLAPAFTERHSRSDPERGGGAAASERWGREASERVLQPAEWAPMVERSSLPRPEPAETGNCCRQDLWPPLQASPGGGWAGAERRRSTCTWEGTLPFVLGPLSNCPRHGPRILFHIGHGPLYLYVRQPLKFGINNAFGH